MKESEWNNECRWLKGEKRLIEGKDGHIWTTQRQTLNLRTFQVSRIIFDAKILCIVDEWICLWSCSVPCMWKVFAFKRCMRTETTTTTTRTEISHPTPEYHERQRSTNVEYPPPGKVEHFCGIGNCQKYASYALISILKLFQVFYCLLFVFFIQWCSSSEQQRKK